MAKESEFFHKELIQLFRESKKERNFASADVIKSPEVLDWSGCSLSASPMAAFHDSSMTLLLLFKML